MLGSTVASCSRTVSPLASTSSPSFRSLWTVASSRPSPPPSSSRRTSLSWSPTGPALLSSPYSAIPSNFQRCYATVIPEAVATVEKDPTYKPPVEIIEPPPAPAPAVIIHYHTDKSTLSILCKTALVESSQARASIFETVRHESPLEINLEVLEETRPSDHDWQLIREIMVEQREQRSLKATPPAVLVPAENEDEETSGIPDTFRAPLVVNLSTRKVCRGPLMYSQLEEMLTEMRNDQIYRERLEDRWDAHQISLGKKPLRRERDLKRRSSGLLFYEKFAILFMVWLILDTYLLPAQTAEAGKLSDRQQVERSVADRR